MICWQTDDIFTPSHPSSLVWVGCRVPLPLADLSFLPLAQTPCASAVWQGCHSVRADRAWAEPTASCNTKQRSICGGGIDRSPSQLATLCVQFIPLLARCLPPPTLPPSPTVVVGVVVLVMVTALPSLPLADPDLRSSVWAVIPCAPAELV